MLLKSGDSAVLHTRKTKYMKLPEMHVYKINMGPEEKSSEKNIMQNNKLMTYLCKDSKDPAFSCECWMLQFQNTNKKKRK